MLGLAFIGIALHRESIGATAPVGAKADLRPLPFVRGIGAAFVLQPVELGVSRVNTERRVAEFAAVTHMRAALLVAGIRAEQEARGLGRRARDDIDDAVDRIRAPERG